MAEDLRIDVEEARRRTQSGDAVLVCAYDDESRCASIRLEGATAITRFRAQQDSYPRDQEIILYCA
jgi:hypothetical protein